MVLRATEQKPMATMALVLNLVVHVLMALRQMVSVVAVQMPMDFILALAVLDIIAVVKILILLALQLAVLVPMIMVLIAAENTQVLAVLERMEMVQRVVVNMILLVLMS